MIQRVASQWQCASAADYPVDRERIRQLLVQLDQLERWEAKTQDPARHAAIDLDVSTEGARAIEIELFAESDLVSHVILGKQQWSPKSTFARLATEDQTFKCKGHVEVEVHPIGWLEPTFCTLDRSGIAEMNFGPMRLVRANTSPESTNDSWDLAADTLDLVPDKAVQLARAELPGWPTRLDFEDVIARDQHQWSSDTVVLTYIAREGQLTVSIDLGEEEDLAHGADWILCRRKGKIFSPNGAVGRGGCTDFRLSGSHRSDKFKAFCSPPPRIQLMVQPQAPHLKFPTSRYRGKPFLAEVVESSSGLVAELADAADLKSAAQIER